MHIASLNHPTTPAPTQTEAALPLEKGWGGGAPTEEPIGPAGLLVGATSRFKARSG